MRSTPLLVLRAVATSCSSPAPKVECTGAAVPCGTNCVALSTDDANCGSCGKACAATEGCANGACFARSCGTKACAPDEVCADQACVSKACVGVTCPGGQICAQGSCTCAPGRTACGAACADLQLDSANCGTCGTACPAGQACAAGACLATSCGGQTCDALSVCYGNRCVERACVGVICPSGQVCQAGACGCPAGQHACAGACSNPSIDDANCGACGHACASTEACAGGARLPQDCPTAMCDALSACVSGACALRACVGVACGSGKHCDSGQCLCDVGKVDCGSFCADLSGDDLECGACGHACAAGTTCLSGACVATNCTGGMHFCSGGCVDLQTNPDHCSACGNACGGGRICTAGRCACPPGLTLCGSTCVNLDTDGANCGACGKTCNGGTCSAGQCACRGGLTLCSGTCRATQSDPLNCNTCGHQCPQGQSCVNGTCACMPGTTMCNGQCIATVNDNLNCGGCNVVCPVSTSCRGSACQPNFTCQAMFNTAPSDCPVFPLSASACGESTMTSSTMWTGSASAGMNSTMPIPRNPGEELRVTGNAFQGFGAQVEYLSSSGSIIATGSGGCCCGACNTGVDVRTTGGAWQCASPVSVIETTQNAGSFTYQIEHWTYSGKYNTGGTTAGAPTDLAKNATSGRVCDQVCGDVKNVCGDDKQFYRGVLPAGKGAVVQATFATRSGSTTFDLNAADMAGGAICPLLAAQTATTTPGSFRARIVNNTTADQTVLLVPTTRNGNLIWNMAVGVEP